MADAAWAFVSSKQSELGEDRQTIKRVLAAHGLSVYLFEDPPQAQPWSATEDWMRAIHGAVLFIGVFGAEYSKASVREYREARRLNLPIYLYVRRLPAGTVRDARISRLLHNPSVTKWSEYGALSELESRVTDDVVRWINESLVRARQSGAVVPAHLTSISLATKAQAPLDIFSQSTDERIRFERRQCDLLSQLLQRQPVPPVVSALSRPIFITRPWASQRRRQIAVFSDNLTARNEALALLRSRYRLWNELVRRTSVRWLIDRQEYERHFLEARHLPGLETADVQAQLRRLISLVKFRPRLAVAASEQPVPMTYSVYGDDALVIHGQTRAHSSADSTLGVRGVIVVHVPTITRFQIEFEEAWARDGRRQKRSSVLAWLEELERRMRA